MARVMLEALDEREQDAFLGLMTKIGNAAARGAADGSDLVPRKA